MYLNLGGKKCQKLKQLSNLVLLASVLLASCSKPAEVYINTSAGFVVTEEVKTLEDLSQDSPISYFGDYMDFRQLVTYYLNNDFELIDYFDHRNYFEVYLLNNSESLRIISKGNIIYVLTAQK